MGRDEVGTFWPCLGVTLCFCVTGIFWWVEEAAPKESKEIEIQAKEIKEHNKNLFSNYVYLQLGGEDTPVQTELAS